MSESKPQDTGHAMKRSNSSTSLPRKGSLEDILNMFPDEDAEEEPQEDTHVFANKFNQWNQSGTQQNANTTSQNNYNLHDERSYLVKSESMTSLSSFGEALDTMNGLSSPKPHPMQPMVKSASSNSLSDYVDSSTLLKSASSSSLTNLHASSLLTKSFSSSSFSRFQEEMEDDEDYNRKYHASSHPQPQHHISEDQQPQHDMYLPPMPHPQDNEQLNEALHLHYQLQQQQAQQQAQQLQQQQLQQMQQLYTQHEMDKTNGYPNLHSLFGQDQQPQREEHQPSPTALNPTSNRISVQYGNEQYTSVDGQLYNDRGYKICGHLNQHNRPCQRIGRCPFHDKLREDEQEASATGDEQQQTEQPATVKKQRTKQEPPHMIQVTPIDESQFASQTPVKKVPFKQGWNKEEHMRFLTGLQTHGKGAWKEIAMIVGTRTPTQIQSHAQKYFLRQKQKNKNKRSIHDFTMDDLNKMSRGPSETDASLIDFSEEQEEPVDNTKKRKQKVTPTQKRKKRKTSYDEDEDEQPMQASQETTTITPPIQTPEQQALFQQQMQQLLQGQIGQMIANGQLDQNQILSSYASLAMLIQNKFGELQQQLQTTTAAPPSEPSSPESKKRQPFAS